MIVWSVPPPPLDIAMPPDLQLTIDHLRRELGYASIELRVNVVTVFPREGSEDKQEYHYAETADGRRLLEFVFTPRGGSPTKDFAYCDGEKCARVLFDTSGRQKQVAISKAFHLEDRTGFGSRPQPLEYFYVGLVSLPDALTTARFESEGVSPHGKTLRYSLANVPCANSTLSFLYDLDAATSVPVRTATFASEAAMREGGPSSSWEAITLDKVGEHTIPLRSHYEHYVYKPGANQRKTASSQDVFVLDVKFDIPLDPALFWPKLEPGVTVIDALENKSYIIKDPSSVQPSTERVKRLIREKGSLEPPARWDHYVAYGSLLAGFLILATVFIKRMRRR